MRLKSIRVKHKVSQAKLAEEMGVAQSTISGWENGVVQKSAEDAVRLADFFDVSVDYLLGRTDNNFTSDAVVDLPIISKINDTEEIKSGEVLTLPVKMLRGMSASDFFVFKVKGNSMYPQLLNGDHVLVFRNNSVKSGATALVLCDGDDAIIRRVCYENKSIWFDLVPNNPDFDTRRIFSPDMPQVRILGKCIKVIRDI